MVRDIAEPVAGSTIVPDASNAGNYARLKRRYAKLEPLAISTCGAGEARS